MKRLLYTTLIWLALFTAASAQSYSLRMEEADGTPNQPGVRTIIVPNGTLSCSGSTCTLSFGGGSVITGSGTAGTMTGWAGAASITNATGFTYQTAASPQWKMTTQSTSYSGLEIIENGASSDPTISLAQSLLKLTQANDASYYALAYSKATVGQWANYIGSSNLLAFDAYTSADAYQGTVDFQPDPSGGQMIIGPRWLKTFSVSATYYGTLEETASDVFSLGLATTSGSAAGIKSLTWTATGVGINKSSSIGSQLQVVSGDATRIAGLIDGDASATADLLRVRKGTTNRFVVGAAGISTATIALGSDATGDLYYNGGSGVLTRLPIGSSTNVLTVSGGVPTWAAASGGAAWSALTDPSGNLALTMAANTTTFTYNATTGANDLFTITDSNNDNGTGYVFVVKTIGGSNTKKPFAAFAQSGVAIQVMANGSVDIPGASPGDSLRIGINSSANSRGVALGTAAVATGLAATAVGYTATTAQTASVSIGDQSSVSGTNGTTVGQASSAGLDSISLGKSAVSVNRSIAIGSSASAGANADSFVVGNNAAASAANQIVFGSSSTSFTDWYVGQGITNATPSAVTLNSTGGTGTNIAGAAFNLAGGKSTGNAVPGRVHLRGGAFLASGTTAQTLIDRGVYGASKILANNTTTTVTNVTAASDTSAGGIVDYAVEVIDGSHNIQIETGSFTYQVTNSNGTIANNTITFPAGFPVTTATSGTLTVSWTITAANPALLQVNANSSLTPSTGYPRVTYSIKNLTSQAIAIQ